MNQEAQYKIEKLIEELEFDPLFQTRYSTGLVHNVPNPHELVGPKAALYGAMNPNATQSQLGAKMAMDPDFQGGAVKSFTGPTDLKRIMTTNGDGKLSDIPSTQNAFYGNPTEKTALDLMNTRLSDSDNNQHIINNILDN